MRAESVGVAYQSICSDVQRVHPNLQVSWQQLKHAQDSFAAVNCLAMTLLPASIFDAEHDHPVLIPTACYSPASAALSGSCTGSAAQQQALQSSTLVRCRCAPVSCVAAPLCPCSTPGIGPMPIERRYQQLVHRHGDQPWYLVAIVSSWRRMTTRELFSRL